MAGIETDNEPASNDVEVDRTDVLPFIGIGPAEASEETIVSRATNEAIGEDWVAITLIGRRETAKQKTPVKRQLRHQGNRVHRPRGDRRGRRGWTKRQRLGSHHADREE